MLTAAAASYGDHTGASSGTRRAIHLGLSSPATGATNYSTDGAEERTLSPNIGSTDSANRCQRPNSSQQLPQHTTTTSTTKTEIGGDDSGLVSPAEGDNRPKGDGYGGGSRGQRGGLQETAKRQEESGRGQYEKGSSQDDAQAGCKSQKQRIFESPRTAYHKAASDTQQVPLFVSH